jgi:hypothetical protein
MVENPPCSSYAPDFCQAKVGPVLTALNELRGSIFLPFAGATE